MWTLQRNGKKSKPASFEKIASLIKAGKIYGDDLISFGSSDKWIPVASTPEFSNLFAKKESSQSISWADNLEIPKSKQKEEPFVIEIPQAPWQTPNKAPDRHESDFDLESEGKSLGNQTHQMQQTAMPTSGLSVKKQSPGNSQEFFFWNIVASGSIGLFCLILIVAVIYMEEVPYGGLMAGLALFPWFTIIFSSSLCLIASCLVSQPNRSPAFRVIGIILMFTGWTGLLVQVVHETKRKKGPNIEFPSPPAFLRPPR